MQQTPSDHRQACHTPVDAAAQCDTPHPRGSRATEAQTGLAVRRPRLRLRQVPPPPAGRGITPKIAHRGVTRGSGLGRTRWVVERTFGWLHQFKRLRIRYEIRTPQASGSARALPMPTCRA
ncbi:transposase [Streptomyces sp. NBC_01077]|uniref:transposase n=1 Tax=Streptomyces sp. NBC_01077 TaxID=2903746 RepID=UPI0038662777